MYLQKRTYIGGEYAHNEISGEIKLTKNGKEIPIQLKRLDYIIESVGYWRKANHIHKWFVENVQKNEDDCGDYYVAEEKLKQLLSICKQIKESPERAPELLPTHSGFFFGTTEYGEGYMWQIDSTIKIIESILAERTSPEYLGFDIIYTSSW